MQIFYEPEILNNGGFLNEEESKHCTRVLRHKTGDIIHVIDGKGTRAVCTITDVSSRVCKITIDDLQTEKPTVAKCHIAIAPTKSIDRFEWFLEKSTELGVDQITPLLCHQSERKQIKSARLDRVITAATKQSLRLWRPVLEEMVNIKDFLNSKHSEEQKYIAHCDESDRNELLNELQKHNKSQDILVMIGPEGDFTRKEIKLALSKGFVPISMGKNRLRTETAGIAACTTIKMISNV